MIITKKLCAAQRFLTTIPDRTYGLVTVLNFSGGAVSKSWGSSAVLHVYSAKDSHFCTVLMPDLFDGRIASFEHPEEYFEFIEDHDNYSLTIRRIDGAPFKSVIDKDHNDIESIVIERCTTYSGYDG